MEEKLLIIEKFLNVIQSTKNLSNKTIDAYRSDLKDFSQFLLHNSGDENIVLQYVQYSSQERNLKDSTIKRRLVVLKMYFDFLYNNKYIEQNDYKLHTFKFKKEKHLPRTLSVKEISKILSFLTRQVSEAESTYAIWQSTRDLALIDILISTGIRIAEASEIALGDIITADRTILIHGKGRKQRLIYISCQQTWTNLMKWFKVRGQKSPSTDKLFINRYGKQLSIHGIEYIYSTITAAAGLKAHSTPHYLRHTFATNLLANGADLRSVQEILGHASVSTTEIYTEVTAKRKKQVMNRFNYRNKL